MRHVQKAVYDPSQCGWSYPGWPPDRVYMSESLVYEAVLLKRRELTRKQLLIGLLPIIITFSGFCLYLININCSQSPAREVTNCRYLEGLVIKNILSR